MLCRMVASSITNITRATLCVDVCLCPSALFPSGQEPGSAPWLKGIFAYNYSALPSLGLSASALSGMKAAMPKLLSGVLFCCVRAGVGVCAQQSARSL